MKFKVIRSEHARSDEVILEGDSLEEIAELARAKSGSGPSTGGGFGFDEEDLFMGSDDDSGGGLL